MKQNECDTIATVLADELYGDNDEFQIGKQKYL